MSQGLTYLRLGTFGLVADDEAVLLGEPFVGTTNGVTRFRGVSAARECVARPAAETFHGFLIRYFISKLDAAWLAAEKAIPLVVFSDINLPVSPDGGDLETGWFKSVEEQLHKHGAKCKAMEKGSPFAGAVMTNYAWHYFGDKTGTPREREVGHLWSPDGVQALDRHIYEDLLLAAGQYGLVPKRKEEW